jgi:hypothetical protein
MVMLPPPWSENGADFIVSQALNLYVNMPHELGMSFTASSQFICTIVTSWLDGKHVSRDIPLCGITLELTPLINRWFSAKC